VILPIVIPIIIIILLAVLMGLIILLYKKMCCWQGSKCPNTRHSVPVSVREQNDLFPVSYSIQEVGDPSKSLLVIKGDPVY